MSKTARRRIEITRETRKLTIIRTSGGKDGVGTCPYCGCGVSTISETNASIVLGVNATDLSVLTRNGKIHYAGGTNLCGDSLADYFGRSA